MAQDETYQTDTYRERPGNAFHIGSDGTATLWSGGEAIGRSNAAMSCEDGFEFFFNDQTISAARMLNFLAGRVAWSVIHGHGAAAGDSVISAMGGSDPPVLPSMMGYIVFSLDDGQSNASARLGSAHMGEDLVIMMRGIGSTGSVLILFSGDTGGLSGVAVIGQSEDAISHIHIQNSQTSFGFVRLIGVEDGVWAVIDNGQSRGTGACVIEVEAD